MRESLAPGSRNVMVHLSAGNGNRLQYRAANGGSSVSTGSGSRPWIRLVRAGTTFTGFSSDDGVSWIQLGVTTMSMPENLYVGLAVTSHRDGYLTTGTFNNVSGLGSLNNPHAAPATTPAATASPLLAFAAVPAPLPVQYPSISAMSEPYPSGYLFDGKDAGVLDLLAEAFGGNPLVARGGGGFQTIIDDRLTLTFVRSSPYLVYEVLATDDAEDWTVLETNPGKVGSEVTVYDTVPASLNPTRTLRLHITTP